jgi:hypothetical protein
MTVISAVASSGITSDSVTITWTTDVPSSSQVIYVGGGTPGPPYGGSTGEDDTLVTSHSVLLASLGAASTYHYAVVSDGVTSDDFAFTTADPPVISSVAATDITPTTATITWSTDVASDSWVWYGLTSGYGSLSSIDGTLVTSHSMPLTGLSPSTGYHFAVLSSGGYLDDFVFTTSDLAVEISSVTAASIADTSATITRTTDIASSSQVHYGRTSAYGSSTSVDTDPVTSHSVNLTGLTAGALYHFQVVSA